jgi:CIC family chloride channel protein
VERFNRLPARGLAALRNPEGGIFLGIALVVGVAVGLGAATLIWVLDGVESIFHELGDVLAGGSAWFLFISVPVGLLAAWWIARRFASEVAGDGVPEVTAALAIRAGYLSTKSIPLKIVATALTLGGGGSAGREGPIVQIGGALGSSISRRFGLGEDQVRSLLAGGAAAGIGASFNAPIAGMLFGLEVILGSFAVRHMSAVVLASISAAVTFRSLVPETELLRGGIYELQDWRELFLYAGMAVIAVFAAVLFLRLLDLVERTSHARARPAWLRPVSLGLVIAALGIFEPRLLGTGQQFVSQLLETQDLGEQLGVVGFGTSLLLILAFGKILATSLTIAAGGSGGAFMPSLFIGATLGAGFAQFADQYWTVTNLSPGAFAVVGMATVFAAVARAPLTAILIVFEVTGARDYELILPLMLSATFATFVADRVHPESVYTMPLARKGINLRKSSEIDLLDSISVGAVMSPPEVVTSSRTPVSEAIDLMDRFRFHGLPVVDDGDLVGVVSITDLLRVEKDRDTTPVAAVMTSRPITVSAGTPVSEAMERMAVLDVGRLPVVADQRPRSLIGVFRRVDAIKAYHQALSESTGGQLDRDRFRQRVDPDAGYYDFRIPSGSVADGREVRSVRWPAGSTLGSVRRGTEVLIPDGGTTLRAGHVVTAFGTDESKRRMIDRMNTGAEEPTAEIELGPIAALGEQSDQPDPGTQ